MSLISWDKPKKIRSTATHNRGHMSDSDIAGTYVPNMSKKDRAKWKGKMTCVTTSPCVEIRKNSFVIVIGLDGYDYKSYRRIPARWAFLSTIGKNVHIASAGPIQLSFKEWEEFKAVVEEAREHLKNYRRK